MLGQIVVSPWARNTATSGARWAMTQAYLDYSGRDDVLTGGVKLIPIDTPNGRFRVWTKRIGNNPSIKVLLLHGGPGATHEYLEAFDSYFPLAGFEYYYYDQLGSAYSDQPDDPELWETTRFVDEVEQVRQALGLGPENFYLYGQSWGGILAMEYALRYQQHLAGLIISNMIGSLLERFNLADRKSTRLNSSLSLHDALPVWPVLGRYPRDGIRVAISATPGRIDHLQYDGQHIGDDQSC